MDSDALKLWFESWSIIYFLSVVAVTVVYLIVRSRMIRARTPPSISLRGEGVYISPAGESEARAARLLPTAGSEDASSLIRELQVPKVDVKEGDRNYLPDEATEWIAIPHFSTSVSLTPGQLRAEFGKEWSEMYGDTTVYGFDPATGLWTFADCGDAPEVMTDFRFSWAYFHFWRDEPLADAAMFCARREALAKKLAKYSQIKIRTSREPEEAEARALQLKVLHGRLSRDALIRLKAPTGGCFAGKDVWDVMLCLGLRWGDMDLFHYVNEGSVGDDSFFSVWTSTEPGYFLPEEVAADRLRVEDLIFGFSIPRSFNPSVAYHAMSRAAEYCQGRLGGSLLDREGNALDPEKEKTECERIVAELRAAGFEPGRPSALHLF